MNSDGSNPTNLIQAIEADNSPSWSPDGKKIAYRACQMPAPYYLLINCQINVMNLADRSIANLSGPTKTDDGHPQWSPDGKKIVFVRNMIYRGYISDFFYELFVMDADGSKLLQITNDPSRNNQAFSPGWSPNGTRIIFTHFGMDGDSGIYTINNDGSGIAAIFTTQSPGGPREPDWK
jgi:Tol biopolymer transport system component